MDPCTPITGQPPGRAVSSYWSGLDGLRGLSVLLVIAFHASVPGFGGGFIGVEIFFVISGFLITGLLLKEASEAGRIDIKAFYVRRALRLLPALALLLVVLMGMWTVLGEWEELYRTCLAALCAMFYSVNWARSYGWADTGLLSHAWSLSIEEQFYILWPLCLVAMLRWVGPRATALLISFSTALIFLSTALRIEETRWTALYLGTLSRSGGILAGASLAAWAWLAPERVTESARRWGWILGPSGLAVLVALSFAAEPADRWLYRIGFPLCGLASAALIACLAWSENGRLGTCFRNPGLVWIGKRSYGLYLWHYPIFILMTPSPWWARATLGTALAVTIAEVSHRFIEAPYMARKQALREKERLTAGGLLAESVA